MRYRVASRCAPRVGTATHSEPKYVDVPGRRRSFVIANLVGIAEAELAVKRVSPTAHLAVFQERAGVRGTRGKLYHRAAHVDVAGGGGGFIVADGGGGAVPAVAEEAVAARAHAAVVQ